MSNGNRARRKAAGLLPSGLKCVARKKDGTPCQRPPIRGAAVCRMHGGAAPQVQRKAAERIAHASDIAVVKIMQLMLNPNAPYAIQLAAAKDLLDRAGITAKHVVELTVESPWQMIIDDIVAQVPDGYLARNRSALPNGSSPRETPYDVEVDDFDDVVDGEVVEPATSDSEQDEESSTPFEGPNRRQRTQEVRHDPPHTARRARRPRRA